MIALILTGVECLMGFLEGKVDYIYVNRMNHEYTNRIYEQNQLDDYLDIDYFRTVERKLALEFEKMNIICGVVYL